MKRKRVSSARRLERGDASRVFKQAKNEIRPGDLVLAVSRVSFWEQKRRGNDGDQLNGLIEYVKTLGGKLVGTVTKTASGYDPIWLAAVIDKAKQLNAKVLFESSDRAVRHPGYCKEDQQPQARDNDLDVVQDLAEGVTLTTVLDPRATPEEVRSYQTKRGLEAKLKRGGKRSGRPNVKLPGYKKKKRLEKRPKAIELQAQGLSPRKIAKQLGEAHTTIVRWLKAA